MTTTKTGASATLARVGVSLALAVSAIGGLATTSSAATATVPVITPSATTGASAGGQTIVLTLASTAPAKFTSGNVGIQFQLSTATLVSKAACSAAPDTAGTTTTATTTLRYLSTTKVSIVTPALSGTGGVYLVCVYNAAQASGVISTGATLLGRGQFTVATAPTTSAISPTSGPALGGQTVTVTGTNFPTAITATTPLSATLGGLALTNITPVSATSFTAITPAKAASATAQALVVTTLGGSVTLASAFTFKNGIVVSPNTVVGAASVDVDIQGVGFSSLTFDAGSVTTSGNLPTAAAGAATGSNSAGAHVYIVQTTAANTAYTWSSTASANKTLGQVSECVDPVVISDTELICTVNAAKKITATSGAYSYATGTLPDGAYTITVVDTGSAAPTYQSVVSSGASFTVAAF